MGDPEARVRAWSKDLNEDVRRLRGSERPPRYLNGMLTAHADVYAGRVGLVLAVLDGVARADEGRSIKGVAIDSVEDEAVRSSVRALLSRYGDEGDEV